MVKTILEKRKLEKNLVFVFIVVLLITGFVVYQGFFKKEKTAAEKQTLETIMKKVEIDYSVLDNPIFEKLQPFEKIIPFRPRAEALPTEEVGRQNPFRPY